MNTIRELHIEDTFSPMYGDTIQIPPRTLVWRGYDPKYPAISTRPAYFSMKEIASGYAAPPFKLSPFYSQQTLNLIDIRFLQVILKQIFDYSRSKYTSQDKNTLLCVQTSFGLCSLGHQLELMRQIYQTETQNMSGFLAMEQVYNSNKLVEQPGVRVAETNIDGFTMHFLQGLFESSNMPSIDGFISPRLLSPFHVEKTPNSMSPEIILFNPLKSQIQELNIATLPSNLPKLSIDSLFYKHSILTFDYGHFFSSVRMHKGGSETRTNVSHQHPLEVFNSMLNTKEKYAIQISKAGYAAGKRWGDRIPRLIRTEPPVPTYPVHFTESNDLDLI
jgi:hypothetical protein